MSDTYHSLAHSKWDCKYHIIFIPKNRRKAMFGKIKSNLGPVFRSLAQMKECNIVEGHVSNDHVHICIEIPPKHSVASIVGFIKGKSAIMIIRQYLGKERNFAGEHFWARGYAVSTIGFDLDQIIKYIKEQKDDEDNDKQGEPSFRN
jgi:putative transposase